MEEAVGVASMLGTKMKARRDKVLMAVIRKPAPKILSDKEGFDVLLFLRTGTMFPSGVP